MEAQSHGTPAADGNTPPRASSPAPFPQGGRYLVTGGGTGGHVYPAIAIADELKRLDPSGSFLYVGVKGRSEEDIVPRRGYPLRFVSSTGFPGGRNPIKLGRFALLLSLGVLKSFFILLSFRPNLVIGTGGFVSAPILMATKVLRKLRLSKARTFIHEQNTFPGRLNRLMGNGVDAVGLSFPETVRYFPRTGKPVGYPVRRELSNMDRAEARAALNIPEDARVVFAFGGSQGARTINRAMVDALPQLLARSNVYVIHGTGTFEGADYNAWEDTDARFQALSLEDPGPRYHRSRYFHNIEALYAAADLVVCRAGAGTLTEICARSLPSLILPKAGLPGDHQVKNARTLAQQDAADVIYERVDPTTPGDHEIVAGGTLAEHILTLLDDPIRCAALGDAAHAAYSADALDAIADTLGKLLEGCPLPESPAVVPKAGPDFEALTGAGLVGWLTRAWRRSGPPSLSEDDRAYLEYRTDRYLANSTWGIRNHGVKLVGLLQYQARRPLLLTLLKDQRPASRLSRLLGGDLQQVGFIRRNLFDALGRLDTIDADLIDALETGLADGYFEARSAAGACASHFADRLERHRSRTEQLLLARLDDPSYEVRIAVIKALGRVAAETDLIETLRPFFFAPIWAIRQAVVIAFASQVERAHLPPDRVKKALGEMLITSNGFTPNFPLKVEMRTLAQALLDDERSHPHPETEAEA